MNVVKLPVDREFFMEMLRTGIVRIVFTKTDGTERTMNCTLTQTLIRPHPNVRNSGKQRSPSRPNGPLLCVVFDVDEQDWRSFRWDSLLSVSYANSSPQVQVSGPQVSGPWKSIYDAVKGV